MASIRGFLLTFTIASVTALAACSKEETRAPASEAPTSVEAIVSADPTPTSIGQIVTEEMFNEMFPGRDPFYTYKGFVAGADAAKGFGTTGAERTRLLEVAAFLANMAHETGWGRYVTEIARNKCPDYCKSDRGGACTPAKGKSYYGRGELMVSWPDNYCDASKFIYHDDGHKLVQDPDILERDPAISIQASLWYWMTQSGPQENNPFPETSAHDCMVNFKGLGCTIWAINGAQECNNPKRAKEGPAQVKSRGENYERIVRILGRDVLGDGKWPAMGPKGC